MKKKIDLQRYRGWIKVTISVFLLVFVNTYTVFAGKLETLSESGDYEAVKSLANRILEFVNGGPTGELNTRDATVEDIDYDNAVKVYAGLPVLQENCQTLDEAKEIIETNDYVWNVPVKVDGYLFEALVDHLESDWACNAVFYGCEQGELTYTEQLDASLEANGISGEEGNYTYIMTNGIPYIQSSVYLIIKDGVFESVIPARGGAAMMMSDSSDKERATKFKQLSAERGAEVFPSYDYKRVQKSVNDNLEVLRPFVGRLTGVGGIDIGKNVITRQYLYVLFLGAGLSIYISGKLRKYFVDGQ